MKRRRTRELQVSRSREILAEFLQIKTRAKRIGSAQLAALQRRSVPDRMKSMNYRQEPSTRSMPL
jgi:hypothetical protein